MNHADKKRLKLRSLRRGYRLARISFWEAEEKYDQLWLKFMRVPVCDQKIFKIKHNMDSAEFDMQQRRLEMEEAQLELLEFTSPKKRRKSNAKAR